MKREYSFKSIILIYLTMLILVVASVYFCISAYIKTQAILLLETTPKTFIEFIDMGKVQKDNEKLKMNLNQYEISQLILSGMKDLEWTKDVEIESLIFNGNSSYISLRDLKKNKIRTLSFKGEIISENQGVNLKLTNFGMGKLNSKVLGKYYKNKLRIPTTMELEFEYTNDLVYIDEIESISENEYKIILGIDKNNLLTRLNYYIENKDKAKIEINKGNENFPQEIISIFNKEKANMEDVDRIILSLQNNKDTLEHIGLLLNESGIEEIYKDLANLYSKDSNGKKVVEKSELQIENNINNFHKEFSTMTLAYLYNNPNYKVENGAIYVDGATVDADKILNFNNRNKEYDVQLDIVNGLIQGEYKIGNRKIIKTILNRGE